MAEEKEAASRTEEPTPRKLQQAREKGDVVKTPDLGPFAALTAACALVFMGGPWLGRQLTNDLMPFVARPHSFVLEGLGGVEVARLAILASLPILLGVMVAAALGGAGGNLIQTGLMFSPDKLKFDFKKVSPLAGFKRLFGIDGLVQFVKSLVKVLMIGGLAWWVVAPFVPRLINLSQQEPATMLPLLEAILRRLVFAVAALLAVVAGVDWLWQHQRFMARMRMTKEELKEDYKQSEGDPYIKARVRQIRHERARRRMMQAVPTATVVVMNPTHYAVALRYEQGETPAPLCVAKGLDTLALKIRELAEEHGVPIIEDAPLARSLYAAVEIDDIIPPAHYDAVAKIIGFILSAGRQAQTRRTRL